MATPGPADDYNPTTLLLGCIDARKPVEKLLEGEQMLIKRNIAANVPEPGAKGSRGMRATLQYALQEKKIRRIVIVGHTDCGGIGVCADHMTQLPHVSDYMSPLNPLRDALEQQKLDPFVLKRRLEQDAVRHSIENLRKYPEVQQALKEGLKIEGWIVDVRDDKVYKGLESGGYIDEIENNRGAFPPHNPDKLVLGCIEAPQSAHAIMAPDAQKPMFSPGLTLIKRNMAAFAPGPENADDADIPATLEFAVRVKKVKGIDILGHAGCLCGCAGRWNALPGVKEYMKPLEPLHNDASMHPGRKAPDEQRDLELAAVRRTMHNLKEYEIIQCAMADPGQRLQLRGLWLDADGRLQEVGEFHGIRPLAANDAGPAPGESDKRRGVT